MVVFRCEADVDGNPVMCDGFWCFSFGACVLVDLVCWVSHVFALRSAFFQYLYLFKILTITFLNLNTTAMENHRFRVKINRIKQQKTRIVDDFFVCPLQHFGQSSL